jgi:hypothetical protein
LVTAAVPETGAEMVASVVAVIVLVPSVSAKAPPGAIVHALPDAPLSENVIEPTEMACPIVTVVVPVISVANVAVSVVALGNAADQLALLFHAPSVVKSHEPEAIAESPY